MSFKDTTTLLGILGRINRLEDVIAAPLLPSVHSYHTCMQVQQPANDLIRLLRNRLFSVVGQTGRRNAVREFHEASGIVFAGEADKNSH